MPPRKVTVSHKTASLRSRHIRAVRAPILEGGQVRNQLGRTPVGVNYTIVEVCHATHHITLLEKNIHQQHVLTSTSCWELVVV